MFCLTSYVPLELPRSHWKWKASRTKDARLISFEFGASSLDEPNICPFRVVASLLSCSIWSVLHLQWWRWSLDKKTPCSHLISLLSLVRKTLCLPRDPSEEKTKKEISFQSISLVAKQLMHSPHPILSNKLSIEQAYENVVWVLYIMWWNHCCFLFGTLNWRAVFSILFTCFLFLFRLLRSHRLHF